MNLALFPGSGHRIITIADPTGTQSAWQSMFDWPARGDRHVGLAADTAAARNLFGVQLDRAVAQADRAVLLVASGAGCAAAAWWARLSPAGYVARVAGALLLAPSQDQPGDRFASPRVRLPFTSIIVDQDAGPANRQRLEEYAQDWGSRVLLDRHIPLHSPQSSERSPWRQARHMIRRWSAAVVAHDERVAEALVGRRSLNDRSD